ncbi:hypothetical protein [Caudoviricetes sp.]|nr:hypothetical protein [Caudoviricetes sp.]
MSTIDTPPMSPREKQAIYIFIFALVFYVAQNQYFGWNAKQGHCPDRT